jgi:hypothetical protein
VPIWLAVKAAAPATTTASRAAILDVRMTLLGDWTSLRLFRDR